jgi:hypothetical protein
LNATVSIVAIANSKALDTKCFFCYTYTVSLITSLQVMGVTHIE